MKVKELLKRLSKFDWELEVEFAEFEQAWNNENYMTCEQEIEDVVLDNNIVYLQAWE